MKLSILVVILCLLISGCSSNITTQVSGTPVVNATEIVCPGMEPKGLFLGGQAYLSLSSPTWSASIFQDSSVDSKIAGELFHHVRVELNEGPKCDQGFAWWRITAPGGIDGWLQVGAQLQGKNGLYIAELLPFNGDAVQKEVPEERSLEAQVRYILADIELSNDDVLKYYQDQLAAKPDDPETKPIRIALEILKDSSKGNILANAAAFERKPLRGGTSVVDAGTEFVQPGLDVLLKLCDVPIPSPDICNLMKP
jgi:hypothetical protein